MSIRNINVLLADDDEGQLESLRSLLRSEGDINVVGQGLDGAEAVRLAEQLCPDLAILDVTMPLMNGIEATGRLRRLMPSVRILLLSAHTSPYYVGAALKAGADGYVAKAAAGRELVTAIRSVLAGNGYVSEALRVTC